MAIRLITRSAWGARPPKAVNPLPPVTAIVAHYSAANADEQADHNNCAARVRAIQRYHMDTQGWNDIAYNFVTCKHGYVFEGRGFNRSGATGTANSHTIAVCFLGDDTLNQDDLGVLGRQALADAFSHIEKRIGKKSWNGHRDYMSTRCPGDEIYKLLDSKEFFNLVYFDNTKRLAALRKWILARRSEGWSWKRIKASPNWREFIRRGGK